MGSRNAKKPNIKLIEEAVMNVYGQKGQDLNAAKVALLSDFLKTASDKGKQYIVERLFGKSVDATKVGQERKQTGAKTKKDVNDLFED